MPLSTWTILALPPLFISALACAHFGHYKIFFALIGLLLVGGMFLFEIDQEESKLPKDPWDDVPWQD